MEKKLKYRPNIDGLRGIAVLLVLLYHFEKVFFNTNYFQGGYIGVDIFFVISGYLISTIIFTELKTTSNFSFKNFYIRRAKRILPVLGIVLIFSLILSFFLFIPEKFDITFGSATSSWFFFSNFFFWKQLSTYHAEESINLPLLHTWSLSVEEQFYILFPLLILIIFFYLNKRILPILISVIIISLFISTYASVNYSNANFYLLPSRVWEILLGSLISYYEIFKNKKFEMDETKKKYVFLGFFSIILFSFIANDKTLHPSLITIIPVLSAFVIICYSENDNFFIYKILSSKFLVYFGLISYSLYLWHYPILVFSNTLNLDTNNLYFFYILIFIIILLISISSYHLIEKPFRRGEYNIRSLISLLIIFSISTIFLNFKNFTNLNHFSKNDMLTASFKNYQEKIKCSEIISKHGFCYLKKGESDQTEIVMLGDSVLNRLVIDLNEKLPDEKYNIINLSRGGSLYTPYGKYININSGKDRVSETQDIDRSIYLKKSSKKKIIIIGAKYRQHMRDYSYIYLNGLSQKIDFLELIFSKEELFQEGIKNIKKDFEKTIKKLLKDNIVILIYPFPEFPKHFIQTLYSTNYIKKNFSYLNTKSLQIEFSDFLEDNSEIINFLNNLEDKNLYKIYPSNLFCDEYKCTFLDKDQPLYYDQIHLTKLGASRVNKKIIEVIKKIDKKF